jgi:hypothetical protein
MMMMKLMIIIIIIIKMMMIIMMMMMMIIKMMRGDKVYTYIPLFFLSRSLSVSLRGPNCSLFALSLSATTV